LDRQKFVYRGTLHWCDEQNSSTVDLVYYTYTTVDRVVAECTKFVTYWSLTKKMCGLNKQKLFAMGTSIEESKNNSRSTAKVLPNLQIWLRSVTQMLR